MRKAYSKYPLDVPNPAFGNERFTWLPMLNIKVARNHAFTPTIPAVVDSGSPYCMFNAGVAEYLGLKLEEGIESAIGGIISDPKEPIYYHRVRIQIESMCIISVMAGFCKKLSVTAILGRNGFFDKFYVRFDHSANPPEVEITRIEGRN